MAVVMMAVMRLTMVVTAMMVMMSGDDGGYDGCNQGGHGGASDHGGDGSGDTVMMAVMRLTNGGDSDGGDGSGEESGGGSGDDSAVTAVELDSNCCGCDGGDAVIVEVMVDDGCRKMVCVTNLEACGLVQLFHRCWCVVAQVGQVTVTYTGLVIEVCIQLDDGHGIDNGQIYVGDLPYPQKKGVNTVAPGQYGYAIDPLGVGQDQHCQTIDLDANDDGTKWIIIHVNVCEL